MKCIYYYFYHAKMNSVPTVPFHANVNTMKNKPGEPIMPCRWKPVVSANQNGKWEYFAPTLCPTDKKNKQLH